MTGHTLFVGLFAAVVSLLTIDTVCADHCSCSGGYSIGGCTTSSARIYSSRSYHSPRVVRGYYYSPQTVYYRSYPSYGYSRSGTSITIGSGLRSGYGYRPYGHSFGPRYGYGFGFGSSFHRHHHHHR